MFSVVQKVIESLLWRILEQDYLHNIHGGPVKTNEKPQEGLQIAFQIETQPCNNT